MRYFKLISWVSSTGDIIMIISGFWRALLWVWFSFGYDLNSYSYLPNHLLVKYLPFLIVNNKMYNRQFLMVPDPRSGLSYTFKLNFLYNQFKGCWSAWFSSRSGWKYLHKFGVHALPVILYNSWRIICSGSPIISVELYCNKPSALASINCGFFNDRTIPRLVLTVCFLMKE